MRNEMRDAPKHLRIGLEVGRTTVVPEGPFERVVLCGMGGSALAAVILQQYVADQIRLDVVNDYALPKGCSPYLTLVIASSYSGNTEETIASFHQAREEGYALVALSHGGQIQSLAEEYNVPHFVVPESIQPRVSIGYGMGIILGILEQLGRIPLQHEILSQIEHALTQKIDTLEALGKSIAGKVQVTVPVIYAGAQNYALARITKIHFNENAKTQSFFNVFPELNHNEMVGYTNLVMKPTILYLKSSFDHERVHLRMKVMKELLEPKDIHFLELVLEGETWLEEVYYGLIVAYFASFYLALANGVDPEPVAMVEDFKKLLV